MDMIPLQASARDTTSGAKALRRSGQVPCIVYGNKVPNAQLQCPENALRNAYVKAGKSSLVELDAAGKKIPVLFHTIDLDPVTDRLSHVDFYAVDLKKEVEALVALRFEGESLAVKEHGGILVTPLTSVKVKCLPSNLPHDLPVSIVSLVELHMSLTVADIALPNGVIVLDAPTTVIATVQEPRAEEVVEAPVAPAEGEAAVAGAEGAEAKTEGAPEDKAAPAPTDKKEKKDK
ncbi:MAG: 50S ribosomal protein L25 [Candidatus Peregrinibacteria bacterium]|nr:50S ribosomal protein L25 [Candidatus Peregrinibacteria bacterium]